MDFVNCWSKRGRRGRRGRFLEQRPRAQGLVQSAGLCSERAPRGQDEGSDTVLAGRVIVFDKAWRYAPRWRSGVYRILE
jgi:hypothetical protein